MIRVLSQQAAAEFGDRGGAGVHLAAPHFHHGTAIGLGQV